MLWSKFLLWMKTSAIALNGDRTAYFNFTGQYILYVRDCEAR